MIPAPQFSHAAALLAASETPRRCTPSMTAAVGDGTAAGPAHVRAGSDGRAITGPAGAAVAVPNGLPDPRQSIGQAPATAYLPHDRVWVHRGGAWRPGVVLAGSTGAVMVRYRPTDFAGTGVETVMAADLAVRDEPDTFLDLDESDLPGWEAALPTRVAPSGGG